MFIVAMVMDGSCGMDEVVLAQVETEAEAEAMVEQYKAEDVAEYGFVVDEYFYYEA